MSQPHSGRRGLLVAGAVALGLGVAVFLIARELRRGPVDDQPPPGATGFREAARESGITFRMAFLPNEQGEKFKVNLYDHGCGVAVGDYDGDGHDDVYFVNQLGTNALYRNKGDGTFEDVTAKAGVGLGDRICVGATFADYDNDGDQDLFVTSTRGGNALFRNSGDGTFEDITKAAGLTLVKHSQTAAFFDYDNDGFLDLFVTNTARWTLDYDPAGRYYPGLGSFELLATSPREENVLYRNNGNGSFADVTAKAGLKGEGWGGDVAVFDFDEDGKLDLLVTNMFGASQLYRNKGDGTFADVTKSALGRTSWGAIGSKAFDFNNDGRLDLYIVDMHSDMWLPFSTPPGSVPPESLRRKHGRIKGPYYAHNAETMEAEQKLVDAFKFRYEDVLFGNSFFKNLGGGKFEEASDRAGLETWWPWGIATADFDNNGYEDAYLPSGMGYPFHYWASPLLMNNGDETFTDRSAQEGIEPPPGGTHLEERIGGLPATKSSRCAATADFDGDGKVDLVVNNFNDRAYYFRNQFPTKNHIRFRLTGGKSNRDAVGAVVRLHVGKEVMVRQVQAATGYLSQSSKTLHFGLGDREKVDWAEVRWPSGAKAVLEGPDANALHRVTEP